MIERTKLKKAVILPEKKSVLEAVISKKQQEVETAKINLDSILEEKKGTNKSKDIDESIPSREKANNDIKAKAQECIDEIERLLSVYDDNSLSSEIGPGAMFCLKCQSERKFYLMVSKNGSCEVEIDEMKVKIISAAAELSKAITELKTGDKATFKGQTFMVEVVW